MEFTRVAVRPDFFADRPLDLVSSGELSARAFRYETGVAGLEISNSCSSMVVLPYMGMQVWFVTFDGKVLSQKSMFDMPQDTTKFGDNYGGFLYHCGLNNINGPADGEADYPMHDVLPFARYRDVYVGVGENECGRYLAVGGTFVFRNSQELHWAYSPELRLYEGKAMVEMVADIENRRTHPLEYLWMCHMNWRGLDGSHFVQTCPIDDEHVQVVPTELGDDSPRAVAIREVSERLVANPSLANSLDETLATVDPELCINYRYLADEDGWAHAMQVTPEGDACYVGWDTARAPYALRWFCRTGDEDGVGIALPSTGTCHSTTYQREHGHFNTLEPGGHDRMNWWFGHLDADEASAMAAKIEKVLT